MIKLTIMNDEQAHALKNALEKKTQITILNLGYFVAALNLDRDLVTGKICGAAELVPAFQVDETSPVLSIGPPLRELNPRNDAAFRFACGDIKPLSRRADKPHIWYYGGYWRVSLWNQRREDLKLYDRAHHIVARINALPLKDRASGFKKENYQP